MSKGHPIENRMEMVEKICDGLRDGIPSTIVCRRLGVSPEAFRDWRRKDVAIANMADAAFEYGMDMIAHRSRKTARGEKPTMTLDGNPDPEAGESTGNVDRDKMIIWHDMLLVSKWDNRYRKTVALANDPSNPLTDAKPPAQLTDEQLMAIANGAAKDSPSDG